MRNSQSGCLLNSFTSCFPSVLLTYCLNDFEIDLVAPIITTIIFVFTYHMRHIYYYYYYYYYYWRKSSFVRLQRSQLRIQLRVRMFASRVCYVG